MRCSHSTSRSPRCARPCPGRCPARSAINGWRDAITAGQGAGNLVAEALCDTIARFNLDTGRLLALIEARSFDLYDDPMPSTDALEGYARDTSSTLFEAVARILTPGRLPPSAVDAAGRAYAITGLLRGLPYQVMNGQLFVPLDVLARFQLPAGDVLAHRNSPALGLVLNALRARARVHLVAMRSDLPDAGPAGGGLPPRVPLRTLYETHGGTGPEPHSRRRSNSPACAVR